jgi:hypothetical protein
MGIQIVPNDKSRTTRRRWNKKSMENTEDDEGEQRHVVRKAECGRRREGRLMC